MRLIAVGDTTFASDPAKGHHSYTVYTTETGKNYYTRVALHWRYAHPVFPTGFRVGGRVPNNVAAHLSASRR